MSSFRKTLNGKRFASGSFAKGQYTEGSETPFTFKSSVQPLTPNELSALPEGKRELAKFRLYTDYQLRTVVRGDSGYSADQVEIDGEWYEITGVDDWKNDVIPHYKAIASLLG